MHLGMPLQHNHIKGYIILIGADNCRQRIS